MPNAIDPHWLELHRRYAACQNVGVLFAWVATLVPEHDVSVAGTLALDQVVLHREQHCINLASTPPLQDQARWLLVSSSGNAWRDLVSRVVQHVCCSNSSLCFPSGLLSLWFVILGCF
jgi:hypothetical protein